MSKKYKFEFRKNGSVIEVDPWDVPEMIKNALDWKPLDDVTPVMLGDAYQAVIESKKRRKQNGNKSRHSD